MEQKQDGSVGSEKLRREGAQGEMRKGTEPGSRSMQVAIFLYTTETQRKGPMGIRRYSPLSLFYSFREDNFSQIQL